MTINSRSMVGVDVGGTFTDLFYYDEEGRTFKTGKVPSNRGNEALGFLDGLKSVCELPSLGAVVHGTTVGTNALLERKGAPVGIITTAGFRDVLEMRRRDRPNTWGLWGSFDPVVPRDMRLEVGERTLADGTIRQAVDTQEVVRAAQQLLQQGARSLAIIFINAYANSQNEIAALDAVRDIWPNDDIATSYQILPEIREFERTSTTALNAYLQPVVGSYLRKLDEALRNQSFTGSFHIIQSNGGVMSTETARRLPVRTALSGPAAGVIAAAALCKAAGYENIITGDLGGTSFDVSLVADGAPALAAQTTIDFGMVVRTPMIEISTIGAGGGSIASVGPAGILQVGPESAGSVPGPVCYAQGNDRPTLTDANVVLGRINAKRPIGGKLQSLDVDAAKKAIEVHVARVLDIDVMAAAEAIVRVANARMAGAVRLVSIERGHDPQIFTAVPFGGGGALHAGALITEVGLKSALVPRFPGVTSALGCVIADIRHDQVLTVNLNLDSLDAEELDRHMVKAGSEAEAVVREAGLSVTGIEVLYELDMHYAGQTHTVRVSLPVTLSEGKTGITQQIIRDAFELSYKRAFSRLLPGIAVRIVSLRTAAVGRRPSFDPAILAPDPENTIEAARLETRDVWFDGAWHRTSVFDRLKLPVDAVIEGPAILEQADATTIVDPGLKATVDRFGNIIMERA